VKFREEALTMFLKERVQETMGTGDFQTRKPLPKSLEPRTGIKGIMWKNETSYPIRRDKGFARRSQSAADRKSYCRLKRSYERNTRV